MIELTDPQGRKILLAKAAVAMVTEAGNSQAWHGVRANVQKFDGKWVEVRDTVEEIQKLLGPAT